MPASGLKKTLAAAAAAAAVGRSSARGTERACMRGEREKEKAVDGCLVKVVLLVFCLDLNAIFCSDMVIRGS